MAIRKRKCENCGLEISIKSEREHPTGWIRTSTSQYGREFDRAGIGWWCPNCEDVLNIKIVGLPESIIKTLETHRKAIAFDIANTLLNKGMIAPGVKATSLEIAILNILEHKLTK